MKGYNELHLCEAEVIVALQEYLDKRMGEWAPQVTAVDLNKGAGLKTFELELTEKKEVAA